ncbi:MAG: F0F1 ATP synthase subunit B [Desulfobulbaceae bacterium]|nr:F0F1 ATP synthase subunit B [Desulfobulbaceae bacterium]HIJ79754.1 F0F1 ATP synthase subunit B [Deltaproteobacteria bacterium]
MKKNNFSKVAVAAMSVLLVLAMAVAAYASADAHGGGGIPEAKLWDLLYRTLNFIALAAILVHFLKKPIVNGLNSRRESIREQLETLESRKAEAEQMYKEAEAKLAKLDQEVNVIIAEAVSQGESEKVRIIEDAERAAGDIKRQAEMAVAYELAGAKRNLKAEVAEQAVLLAEELIKKNLQQADQDRMVADYLDKVGGLQ